MALDKAEQQSSQASTAV